MEWCRAEGFSRNGEKCSDPDFRSPILRLPLKMERQRRTSTVSFKRMEWRSSSSLWHRDFFECLLDSVPSNGTIQGRYQAVKPILDLVKDQPQLTWDEYAKKIGERVPGFQKEKVLEELGSLSKGEKESGKRNSGRSSTLG